MSEVINIVPSWRVAAQIIEVGLVNGTYEGKEIARAELMRMADICDKYVAEQQDLEPSKL